MLKIFLIYAVVVGNWFAVADAESLTWRTMDKKYYSRFGRHLWLNLGAFTAIESGWFDRSNDSATAPSIREITFHHVMNNVVLRQLVNEVPSYIGKVGLSVVRFKRIEKGLLNNAHTWSLTIGHSDLNEIADDAIDMPFLEYFHLNATKVKDMKFVATLPKKLTNLIIDYHPEIIEVPKGTFQNNVNLKSLDLSCNKIRDVQPGAFDNLRNLESIDLHDNSISLLEIGVFAGLESLEIVYLQYNNIKNIAAGTFDLPKLEMIALYRNDLETIAKGAVKGSPRRWCWFNISFTPLCTKLTAGRNECEIAQKCSEYVSSPPVLSQ